METIADFIADITCKTGPNKDGGTYTRYTIETRQNGFMVTFNSTLALACAAARRANKPLKFSYHIHGNYKRLERVQPTTFFPLDKRSS